MNLVLSVARPFIAARFGFLADSVQYPLVPASRQARSGSGSATVVATLSAFAAARGLAERSKDAAQRGVQHQGGEQDQAGVAVGLEHLEAIVRVGGVEADDLPGEVGGEGG